MNVLTGVIYKATNVVNGKSYIGQRVGDFEPYKNKHIKSAMSGRCKKKHFYNALRKYGPENFNWEILEYIESSSIDDIKTRLNTLEIEYIDFFKTFGEDGIHYDTKYGYNHPKGGEGSLGRKASNETIEKFKKSIANISDETRQKMSESGKNKIFTKTHRQNLSKSRLGKKRPNSFKNKISEAWKNGSYNVSGQNNPMYGKKQSDCCKNKISEKAKSRSYILTCVCGNVIERKTINAHNKFCKHCGELMNVERNANE